MLYSDQNFFPLSINIAYVMNSVPHLYTTATYTPGTSKLFLIFQICFIGWVMGQENFPCSLFICYQHVHSCPLFILSNCAHVARETSKPFGQKMDENKTTSADHHVTFPLVLPCLADGRDLPSQLRL